MGVRKAWRGLWATEHRADQESYTEQVIGRMLGDAEGSRIRPDAIAVVETAVQLYESVFASATVEPLDQRTASISPAILGLAGRSLARTGNALFRFDIQRGRNLELIPVTSFLIQGAPHPSEWRYSVNLSGPSEIRTQHDVPAEGIVHFRLRASADAAWPWKVANFHCLGHIESRGQDRSRRDERTGVPAREIDLFDLLSDNLHTFIEDVRKGGLSFIGGSDDQAGPTPSTREPHKIGPAPSEAQINLRTETAQSVLSMFGIRGGLFGATGDSDARESWRRFVLGDDGPHVEGL